MRQVRGSSWSWVLALALSSCVSTGGPMPTNAENDRNGSSVRDEDSMDEISAPISPTPRESDWKPLPQSAFRPVVAPTPAQPAKRRSISGAIVVVDAGHGGKDPGSNGGGVSSVWEKQITLGIAKELAAQLRKDGVKVVMTRENDSFIELDDRAAIAARSKCDLFVSVHANSLADRTATGVEVYTSRTPSDSSRRLSSAITSSLRESGIPVRGQRTANYRVLVGHSRPGVLVECGYLTNAGEAKLLNTPAYRTRVARAIADGVEDALGS